MGLGRVLTSGTFHGVCECDRVNGGAMYAREPVPSGDSYERDARVGVSIGPRMKPHIGDFSRLGKLCRIGCYTILSSRFYSRPYGDSVYDFWKMIKLSTNQKASLTEMPRSHWPILVRLE